MLHVSSLIGMGADQQSFDWIKAASFATSNNTLIDGESVAVGNTQSAIAANFTFVTKILPAFFLPGVGGPYVRIRLSGPVSGAVSSSVTACYIGNAATSGNAYNFDSNQTAVTWGSSATILLPPGQHLKSDTIAPTTAIDWTKAVLIALNVASGSPYRYSTGLGSNLIAYAKTGVSEAASTSKGASYTSTGSGSGRLNFLTGLETAS